VPGGARGYSRVEVTWLFERPGCRLLERERGSAEQASRNGGAGTECAVCENVPHRRVMAAFASKRLLRDHVNGQKASFRVTMRGSQRITSITCAQILGV